MKIKLIDFGLEKDHYPFRPHENDAGADVYMPYDCTLKPGEIARIPLGFGLMIPDGYAGYVFPRSSMAAKGLVCELPPIDSGYRGEIHVYWSSFLVTLCSEIMLYIETPLVSYSYSLNEVSHSCTS